jgi:hypothetical protein
MVMGAYTMWKVAQARGWKPGSFCNDNFTFERQLWIGEINTINAAGFYAANVQKLVAAIDAMEFDSL